MTWANYNKQQYGSNNISEYRVIEGFGNGECLISNLNVSCRGIWLDLSDFLSDNSCYDAVRLYSTGHIAFNYDL